VTLRWGIPDEAIAPVLRLCDPGTEPAVSGQPRSEPLIVWLSKRLPDKTVVGPPPGALVSLEVTDGQFRLDLIRQQ
jgi:hypothetical protein